MNDGTKRISRRELYEQVWSISMVKLSKQYGLSDSGLAKICRRNNIPRPPRGYWARKEAGYEDKKLPLPPGENVTIEINPSTRSRNAYRRKNLESKILPSQQSGEEPIVVPDRLVSPHDLVRQSSEILNGRQPNDVGLIEPLKKRCLDITVSKGCLRRALRIIDTVIKALEKQGYGVYLSGGHTKTKVLEVPISFGISEKLVTKKKRPEEHDLNGSYRFGHSWFTEIRVPSGDLSLTILEAEGCYIYDCQKNWNDGKKSKIENRINSFIDGLKTVAVAKIEREKEREEKEHQRIERQRQIEIERREREELRRRYLEEEARVENLISQAENWKKSQILREYLMEIKGYASDDNLPFELEKPFEEWLNWAHDQADRLDPLTPSPPSILDEECPEEDNRNDHHYRW